MMKTWKKLLSLVVVLVMTTALLAACGSGETTDADKTDASSTSTSGSTATTNDTASAGAATTSDAGVTTIRVYRDTFNLGAVDQDQVKKVETAINDYIAKNTDKKVAIALTDIINSEYPEKANLALVAGEVDLVWTASWQSVIGTNDLYANKAAYDITDLLPGTDVYNSMDAGQWEASKYDGRNYFVPVYKDNVEGYDFVYRQDLADKLGLQFTDGMTLKDLEANLEKLKNDGVKYPYVSQGTAMFFRYYLNDFDFFTQDALFAVDRKTNEVIKPFETPQYKEFCKLMSEWVEKGYMSEDDLAKLTTSTTLQTQDWGISWWTDLPFNDEADSRYGQDVSFAASTDRWVHSTSNLGSCYAIAATCTPEVAKACLDFLGILYTDVFVADTFTFGIEGEDFEYDANHQVTQHSEKFNHSMWESASATIVTPLDNEPANKASLYEAFNGGANTSCAAGFRFDKAPVEAEYTACKAIADEYDFTLQNGGYDSTQIEEIIAEYAAALDAAGYQKIFDAFKAQYDAWK